jgi:EAL domain-containing protein (putative c-di-GMP-specific phosphodiesterase class I)
MRANPQLSFHAFSDSRLRALLADSLARDPAEAGFEVHYQPIVRFEDGATVAVEALPRWHHPTAGRIAPHMFAAAAEHIGLMAVLDDFVLNRACADARMLADTYGPDVSLHVNVSSTRLGRPDLNAAIHWALERHGLRARQLTLEITETSRITDLSKAADSLQRIRERGVRVALDDFGSGLHALKQLHTLPVDLVKLDPTLPTLDVELWRMEALCRSLLSICEQMSLTVAADGIATAMQAFVLRRLGCHLGQGELYGVPQPLAGLLAQQRGLPGSVAKRNR